MKAVWDVDYDFHTDKCYDRPTCPKCDMPLFNSNGVCECGEKLELDQAMLDWFKEREGTKEEIGYCFNCEKDYMKITCVKNRVTKEWQTAYGCCSECGIRFIV